MAPRGHIALKEKDNSVDIRPVKHLLPIALIVCALAACVPIQAPAASPTEAATAVPAAEATVEATAPAAEEGAAGSSDLAVVPLDSAECETFHHAITERLGVDFTMTTPDFASEVAHMQGTSCTISATGTGQEFGNFVDVAQAIREIFTTEGWTENQAYLADGPTGTVSGYESDFKTAFVHVGWEPSEEANCPTDQPISACNVEPSQQLFTVTIELVQAAS
jgi:hypothetical protein